MDINHQEGEWTATMSFAEEYAVSRSQIRSRVVRYHEDGVTVVVSRGTDGQL